ncbi:MAG TPA: DUF6691 family protein [Paraburkholderia sp.]|jgi:hypothetical protein|nr:DUF6691 family protein [Paraburkholderia sp.]
MKVRRYLASLVCGLLFGAGLALAGMTRPQKVLGFLDVAGHWDPSLLFVLGGALLFATVAFRLVLRRGSPLLETSFDLPATKTIDARLVGGALIFGLGWGLSGFCPGPAIALLAAPNIEALYFLPAMLAGWWLYDLAARGSKGRGKS